MEGQNDVTFGESTQFGNYGRSVSQGSKKKTESCWGVQDSVNSNLIKKKVEKYYKMLLFCALYCKNGALRNHLQIRIELAEIII